MNLLAGIDESDFGAPIAMPARSVLFSLQPIGVGTPRQEGLLSFLVRTSRAHAVNPRRLIQQVLPQSEPGIGRLAYAAFFSRFAGTINGMGTYAEQFASAMERLAGKQNLRHLTLRPWKDLFPHNGQGLLTRHPKWCPECLLQQRREGAEAYFPLAWAMETFVVCDIHNRYLETHCPVCGKQQPFVPRYPDLGLCDHCLQPLASEASVASTSRDNPASRIEAWVSAAVGDMLSRQSQQDFSPSVIKFREFVQEQVRVLAEGNRAAFCMSLGFDRHGLNGWLDKGQRPSITQFLALCYGVNAMPADIFSETLPHACERPTISVGKLKGRASCPRPKHDRRKEIQERLTASLVSTDCPPVASIAADLGVGPGCLRYWFPDLCRALSDRYRSALKERAAANQAIQSMRVRQVVGTILAEGEYPSRRRVNTVLHRERMSLALPHLLEAYLNALSER